MELSDILHNLKIQELTPMQEAAKEAYQSAQDLVLLSPTGSGILGIATNKVFY